MNILIKGFSSLLCVLCYRKGNGNNGISFGSINYYPSDRWDTSW